MIPNSISEFYSHRKSYAQIRQKDCDIAEGSGLFEKINLSKIKHRESGDTDTTALPYNWFYNRKGRPQDLAYVISPDARVPNYSTNFGDALEIAISKNMKEIPIPRNYGDKGAKEVIDFILSKI